MTTYRRQWAALIALAALTMLPASARAAGTPVKPSRTWSGSVADEMLMDRAPVTIARDREFARLWEAWKIPGRRPTVNFTKDLLTVVTTRGGHLNPVLTLEDGNLNVTAIATRDLRPGFRYVVAEVSRKGIRSVNSLPLGPLLGTVGGGPSQGTLLQFQTRSYKVKVSRAPGGAARMEVMDRKSGRYLLRGNPARVRTVKERTGRGFTEYTASRSDRFPPTGTAYIVRRADSGRETLTVRRSPKSAGVTEAEVP